MKIALLLLAGTLGLSAAKNVEILWDTFGVAHVYA